MNSKDYKAITGRPDCFSRDSLDSTMSILVEMNPGSAERIKRCFDRCEAVPLPKLYIGDGVADYFIVNLSAEDVELITDALFDAEARAVGPDGDTTAEASFAAGLLDRWSLYLEWLEED